MCWASTVCAREPEND
jgi:hypothetical protein